MLQSGIIYDSSAIINVGGKMSSSYGGRCPQKLWNTSGFPTGGLYLFFGLLLKDIKDFIGPNSTILAAFDSPESWRRDIYPGYKASRRGLIIPGSEEALPIEQISTLSFSEWKSLPPSVQEKVALRESINLQIQAIKRVLDDVGIPTVKVDGLEADDLIYMSAACYPDAKLVIRADDHDLADTKLYNKNIKFRGITTNSTLYLQQQGQLINKIAHGCTSDEIPALPATADTNTVIQAIAEGVLNPFLVKNGRQINYEPLRELGISENAIPAIARNIYLVLPFLYQITLNPTTTDMVDYDKLYWWLCVYGQKMMCKRLGRVLDTEMSGVKEQREENSHLISQYLRDYLSTNSSRYLQ